MSALLGVVGLLGLDPAAAEVPASADRRPTIVVVLLDDLDAVVTPMWDAMPRTRALVRDRGVELTRAYAPNPLCCPARATLLTGQHAHNTGVWNNTLPLGGWGAFVASGAEDRTVAVDLQASGYHTAMVGKYLNGNESDPAHIPAGWSDWYGSTDGRIYTGYGYRLNENGTLVRYGSSPDDYATDVLAAKARQTVRNAVAADDPLFLFVSPTAPHEPLPPAPRHLDHPWKTAPLPPAPNRPELDMTDKPLWLRWTAPWRAAAPQVTDLDHQRRMGSLLAVDDLVGGIADELAAAGRLENTYLVVLSDNGWMLGAHGFREKMVPYEESARVPFALAGPGIVAGQQRRDLVSLVDLAPTVRDWAGVTTPRSLDGRSLVPLLGTTGAVPWRQDLLLEYRPTPPNPAKPLEIWTSVVYDIPEYRAVRNDRYLYVEWWADPKRPAYREYELYDMVNDPYQLQNLMASPWSAVFSYGRFTALRARAAVLATCAGATC